MKFLHNKKNSILLAMTKSGMLFLIFLICAIPFSVAHNASASDLCTISSFTADGNTSSETVANGATVTFAWTTSTNCTAFNIYQIAQGGSESLAYTTSGSQINNGTKTITPPSDTATTYELSVGGTPSSNNDHSSIIITASASSNSSSACTISSFTADGNSADSIATGVKPVFVWTTSNCASASIVQTDALGNITTVYTMTTDVASGNIQTIVPPSGTATYTLEAVDSDGTHATPEDVTVTTPVSGDNSSTSTSVPFSLTATNLQNTTSSATVINNLAISGTLSVSGNELVFTPTSNNLPTSLGITAPDLVENAIDSSTNIQSINLKSASELDVTDTSGNVDKIAPNDVITELISEFAAADVSPDGLTVTFASTTSPANSNNNNSNSNTPANTSNSSSSNSNINSAGVSGGLVPNCNKGALNAQGQYATPCNLDQLVTLVNNVINFLLFYFATPLFAIILCYMGWIMLSSGGNSESVSKVKHIAMNALLGYLVALAAWLIVKAILLSLGFNGTMFLS